MCKSLLHTCRLPCSFDSHYSKSQIFVQKFNFDKTPTFLRVFHPKVFWQFFSWNQSCQQLKSPKPQHFHEFFTQNNWQFSREIKFEFLDKKWRFRTMCFKRLQFSKAKKGALNGQKPNPTLTVLSILGHWFVLQILLFFKRLIDRWHSRDHKQYKFPSVVLVSALLLKAPILTWFHASLWMPTSAWFFTGILITFPCILLWCCGGQFVWH